MVVCVLCAAGPNGRGVFWVQLGAVAGGLRAVGPDGLWIVPLCLILTAFFPPSPERAETLRRNLLFEGTMLIG